MEPLIRRQSVADQIVTILRDRILQGEMPDGTPLRQENLAAEFKVSRIPLREAIRQLEAEGLVETELHRGAVVRAMRPDELQELFDLRLWIEPELLTLAVPRFTAEDARRTAAILAASERIEDSRTWADMNWQFHESLYAPSGRLTSLRFLRQVHNNAHRYINTHLHVAPSKDPRKELEEHHRLLQLATAGDVAGARQMLFAHLHRVIDNLGTAMIPRPADLPAQAGG